MQQQIPRKYFVVHPTKHQTSLEIRMMFLLVGVDLSVSTVSYTETVWVADGLTSLNFNISHDLNLDGANPADVTARILWSLDPVPDEMDEDSGL